ncbi:MAG: Lrp/AsnC family transcriptional regulator [Candidatus Hodarchaeales archaeon]|jgi:DNA-binding Lrp family transcriptional regulator
MLDAKDKSIVEYYKNHPRHSFNAASSELKLHKATVKRRFEELVDKDLIQPLLCVNVSKLNFSHALSFIEIINPTTEKALLNEFTECPLVTTMFSLSGFEYNIVICLVSDRREDLTKFMDTFPISRLEGVKRRNTFPTKESKGFAELPFWIPLSKDPKKPFFEEPECGKNCEDCPIINKIEADFIRDNEDP